MTTHIDTDTETSTVAELQMLVDTLRQNIETQQERINSLIEDVRIARSDLDAAVARAGTAVTLHEEDMLVVSDHLKNEAAERGWCADFDRFVDKVNRELNKQLEPRIQKYNLDMNFRVRVTCAPSELDDVVESVKSYLRSSRIDEHMHEFAEIDVECSDPDLNEWEMTE